jgi:hypothetical protein
LDGPAVLLCAETDFSALLCVIPADDEPRGLPAPLDGAAGLDAGLDGAAVLGRADGDAFNAFDEV